MRRWGLALIAAVLLGMSAEAQQWSCVISQAVRTYANGDWQLTLRCLPGDATPVRGDTLDLAKPTPPPPPPPDPVDCAGTWSPWTASGTWSTCDASGQQFRTESRAFTITTPPSNGGLACPASPETRTVTQACTPPPPPPPPAPGDHGYFDMLRGLPEFMRGHSLRPQPGAAVGTVHYEKQLLSKSLGGYAQGGTTLPYNVIYDPVGDPDPRKQDAAKLTVAANNNDIANFLYLPFGATTGTYLVTWDIWWGAEFDYGNTQLATYKTIQIRQPSGANSPCVGTNQWFEIQHRFSAASGAAIARVTGRSYFPNVDPVPNVVINPGTTPPTQASFTVQPERWVRYWLLIDRTGAQSAVSLWVADPQTGPVLLIDRFLKTACTSLHEFEIEFNTSSAWVARPIGPLVAYLKNVAMLRNVANPTTLMQRPQ